MKRMKLGKQAKILVISALGLSILGISVFSIFPITDKVKSPMISFHLTTQSHLRVINETAFDFYGGSSPYYFLIEFEYYDSYAKSVLFNFYTSAFYCRTVHNLTSNTTVNESFWAPTPEYLLDWHGDVFVDLDLQYYYNNSLYQYSTNGFFDGERLTYDSDYASTEVDDYRYLGYFQSERKLTDSGEFHFKLTFALGTAISLVNDYVNGIEEIIGDTIYTTYILGVQLKIIREYYGWCYLKYLDAIEVERSEGIPYIMNNISASFIPLVLINPE
jgi:hypothetical protein